MQSGYVGGLADGSASVLTLDGMIARGLGDWGLGF